MSLLNALITKNVSSLHRFLHLGVSLSILFLITALSPRSSSARDMPEPQIDFAPKQYMCYRTDDIMVMDGHMDETAFLLQK